MTNYQKGYTFEYDFVKSLRERPEVLLADRFLKSIGPVWKPDFDNFNRWGNYKNKHAPVDVWWLETDGSMHYAQLKKGNLGIQTPEMLSLLDFADYVAGSAKVYLISKKKKQIYNWQIAQTKQR